MKYKNSKVSKVSPEAGRFTDLTVKVVSTVDSPANLQDWLVKKGIKQDMDEEQLKDAGLSKAAIEKAVADLPADQKEGAKKGFVDVLKGLGIIKYKEPVKQDQPLTQDIIAKMISDGIAQGLSQISVKKNDDAPQPETADLAKENADLKAQIEAEKQEIEKSTSLANENAQLKAELDEVKKMRTSGNSIYKSNNDQPQLTEAQIKKQQDNEAYKDTAFDFSGLRST